MYEQQFITEVDNLVDSFKDYDLNTMKLSFAIAVILLNKYQLANAFNSLMELYNQQKVITVESKSVIEVVKD